MSSTISRRLAPVRLGILTFGVLMVLIAASVSAPAVVPAHATTAGRTVTLTLKCTGSSCSGSWFWHQGGITGPLLGWIDRRPSGLDDPRDDDPASRRGYVELRRPWRINERLRERFHRVLHSGECHQLHGYRAEQTTQRHHMPWRWQHLQHEELGGAREFLAALWCNSIRGGRRVCAGWRLLARHLRP